MSALRAFCLGTALGALVAALAAALAMPRSVASATSCEEVAVALLRQTEQLSALTHRCDGLALSHRRPDLAARVTVAEPSPSLPPAAQEVLPALGHVRVEPSELVSARDILDDVVRLGPPDDPHEIETMRRRFADGLTREDPATQVALLRDFVLTMADHREQTQE
jgi:hypothetical protein